MLGLRSPNPQCLRTLRLSASSERVPVVRAAVAKSLLNEVAGVLVRRLSS